MTVLQGVCRRGVWAVLALTSAASAAPLRWVTGDFPPYAFERDGKAVGPLVEVLSTACARVQRRCTLEVMPWQRAQRMAEHGAVDGIFPLVRLPERELRYYFSPPLVDVTLTLFAPAASRFTYRAPADLSGRTVGVYGPSGSSRAFADATRGVPGLTVSVEIDNPTALRKLVGRRYGEQGLVVMNRDLARILIRRDASTALKAVGDVKSIGYHFALSRGAVSAHEAEQFNAAFDAMRKEGQLKAILNRHGLRPARLP